MIGWKMRKGKRKVGVSNKEGRVRNRRGGAKKKFTTINNQQSQADPLPPYE